MIGGKRWTIGLVAALISSAGCESRQYVYRPAVNTSASIAGRPASYYPIPPGEPRGDVRIATFGLVDIRPENDDSELRGVHLRMIVANNSDAAWSVDTREQRLVLPGAGESRPAFARVDVGDAPVVTIPPGGKRSFDLFYPLPPRMQEASELPSFDTLWRVQTGTQVVVERTPFERLDVTPVYEPAPYPVYYGYGWGPPYYYDPWYPSGGAFVGVHVGPAYGRGPVIIHRHAPPPPRSAPPARRVR